MRIEDLYRTRGVKFIKAEGYPNSFEINKDKYKDKRRVIKRKFI